MFDCHRLIPGLDFIHPTHGPPAHIEHAGDIAKPCLHARLHLETFVVGVVSGGWVPASTINSLNA